MRSFVLLIATLLATSALAHEPKMEVPQATLVDADLILNPGQDNETKLLGPWFLMSVQIENTTPDVMTLKNMDLVCVTEFQTVKRSYELEGTIAKGAKADYGQYVDSLPQTDSKNFTCRGLVMWNCSHKSHVSAINFIVK